VARGKRAAEPLRPRARLVELGVAGDAGASAHYADPAYYDTAYAARRQDLDYYVRLGRLSGGPVLEYGVGSGRIALALCRAGVDVTGVDLSAPMLEALRGKLAGEPPEVRRRLRLRRGDMRRVRLRARFPLVIAPFNTVLHLYTRADMEAFLTRVHGHLTPRGRLVFDFSLPSPDDLAADPERRYRAPRFRHPTAGLTRYAERFEYDPIRQLLLVHMEFEPESGAAPWSTPLTHRQFFPEEMEALLHYNGFGDIRMTGDFSDRAPGPDADSLVVSCRPRRAARGARPGRADSSRMG
jgi:SAM-dependent methyltransferase